MAKPMTVQGSRDKLFVFLGSAFGLGLLPVAPGSFGALAGVAWHALAWYAFDGIGRSIMLIGGFLTVCVANHLLTRWAEAYWGECDPSHFVLDEVAGYLLVAILYPANTFGPAALWGFVLFRVFDIIKLPIARQIDQKMHNAWGILLDDLVSALYAVGVMLIMRQLSRHFGWGVWFLGV